MSRITQYGALTYPGIQKDDLLIGVDVHDTSMASSGTDKKIAVGDLRGPFRYVTDYNADPTFTNDSTTAFNNMIADLNSSGGTGYIPYGQYKISSALTPISGNGVCLLGDGWAQANNTKGSVISASATIAGTLLSLTGESVRVRGITVDGGNKCTTVIAVTGAACGLSEMQARAATAGNVLVDVQSGGSTFWATDCVFNGINGANTALQINDTDAIVKGCKPKNCGYGIVLLAGSSGALIESNHWTPGSGSGVNGVYINGSPGRITIKGNRFDNYVASALQISPVTSYSNTLLIEGNIFYSTVMTDATWAAIGYDTSNTGVRGLQIINNTVYSPGTNRPLYFLAAQTAAGAAATNPGNIAALGSIVSGNSAYVSSGFYGASSSPLCGRGNIVTLDGTTWTVVADN